MGQSSDAKNQKHTHPELEKHPEIISVISDLKNHFLSVFNSYPVSLQYLRRIEFDLVTPVHF